MGIILKSSSLSKNYGAIQAVRNLDLEISNGQVYGILGPNGSGKTTTLGMILGIITPSSGNFFWFDRIPLKAALKRIGAIIEVPTFYPHLSAFQNLKIIAEIKGKGLADIQPTLEKVGLAERQNNAFKTYSLGMKQRLALAAALLAEPEVLVLDEPTNGMDPQGIADIRNLILDVANTGTTIFLASHLLDEVQKICSHVAVLDKGVKIFDAPVERILADNEQIEIWADDPEMLHHHLKEFKGLAEISRMREKFIIQLAPGPTKKDLHKYLIEKGVYPTHFVTRAGTLESKFLELLKH
jgi:ABC-type multidrug transport system ATPase subunit